MNNYLAPLIQAHMQALGNTTATNDPLTNALIAGGVDQFDYAVEYFENAEEQGVDPENILAAGTLYYIKTLADDLGILRVTDAVIMRWTSGMLDIPQGGTASALYRYFKLGENRTKFEDRTMLYKMALNSGNGEVLDNVMVNRDFTALWDTLMTEVVSYIDKYERKDGYLENVSRSGIYQAIKDLQYNLTMFSSGIIRSPLLAEMYKQLEHAYAILDDPNVKDQLGRGYRRSMWNVVERISQEEFNYMPNVSAMRTSAVNGHKIFSFIASFDEAHIAEDAFHEFKSNVESFIIAQSQLSDQHELPQNGQPGTGEAEEVMDNLGEDEWDF